MSAFVITRYLEDRFHVMRRDVKKKWGLAKTMQAYNHTYCRSTTVGGQLLTAASYRRGEMHPRIRLWCQFVRGC